MSDDEVFGSQDPYAPRNPFTPRKKAGCGIALLLISLVGAGGLGLVVCCGGLAFLGVTMTAEQVAEDLRGNPVVDEHVGPITSIDVDWMGSLSATGDEFVFDVTGPKGKGELRVISVTVDGDTEDVVSGTLETPDGVRHDLFPEGESAGE